MTSIDKINPGQTPAASASSASGVKGDKDAFQKLLDQAAAQVEGSAAPAASQAAAPAFDPLASLQNVKPVQPGQEQELSPAQTEGLMRAERTLELLEDYEKMLGDQGKSLKQVSQLVQSLDGEVRELAGVLNSLDPGDQLYGILQEVAVTAMVESIKFNRGDYIPQSGQA